MKPRAGECDLWLTATGWQLDETAVEIATDEVVFDPEADVLLADSIGPALMRGSDAVASHALTFRHGVHLARPALVEGAISEIEVVTDAERLHRVHLAALGGTQASSDA